MLVYLVLLVAKLSGLLNGWHPKPIGDGLNKTQERVQEMEFKQHKESGIKIFNEFIHSQDLNNDFLIKHEMTEGDVFIASSTFYVVEKSRRRKGELICRELNPVGLDEWVMGGGNHLKVKFEGVWIYDSDDYQQHRQTLIPCKGKTWLFANGEIFDCLDKDNEVKEWGNGKREFMNVKLGGKWRDD